MLRQHRSPTTLTYPWLAAVGTFNQNTALLSACCCPAVFTSLSLLTPTGWTRQASQSYLMRQDLPNAARFHCVQISLQSKVLHGQGHAHATCSSGPGSRESGQYRSSSTSNATSFQPMAVSRPQCDTGVGVVRTGVLPA